MTGYFIKNTVPVFKTCGVAEEVDSRILSKCYDLVSTLRDRGIKPDYLQVFEVGYDPSLLNLTIRQKQEVPLYEEERVFHLPGLDNPFVGKIWCIDDGDHWTFLKPDEY